LRQIIKKKRIEDLFLGAGFLVFSSAANGTIGPKAYLPILTQETLLVTPYFTDNKH
jgi:hypothetical protein